MQNIFNLQIIIKNLKFLLEITNLYLRAIKDFYQGIWTKRKGKVLFKWSTDRNTLYGPFSFDPSLPIIQDSQFSTASLGLNLYFSCEKWKTIVQIVERQELLIIQNLLSTGVNSFNDLTKTKSCLKTFSTFVKRKLCVFELFSSFL